MTCAHLMPLVLDEAGRCDNAWRLILVLALGFRHIVFLESAQTGHSGLPSKDCMSLQGTSAQVLRGMCWSLCIIAEAAHEQQVSRPIRQQ